jgi:phospholipid/cholesterol/gamma-HCH transport system substrate-binding protein
MKPGRQSDGHFMNRDTKETLIGALTIFVFVGFIWLASGQGDSAAQAGQDDGFYRLTGVFNKVDGLLPGDEVRLSGIQVGIVESQTLDSSWHANLVMAIDNDIQLPLDTSAAIHTNGLFGSKFIVLEPGGEYDYLTNGDEIMFTQGSVVVEDLLELIIAEGKANRLAQ